MDTGNQPGKADSDNEGFDNFVIHHNPSWKMELLKPTHTKYCLAILFRTIPNDYQEYDTSKLTLLQFVLSTLDLLQTIDCLREQDKQRILAYVYSLQVSDPSAASGFYGSKTLQFNDTTKLPVNLYSTHVTMTFAALVCLLTLGDNLERVNVKKLLNGVGSLQNKDGSFRAGPSCCESDMRFVYSAIAVCYILNDFSSINIPSVLSYIRKSLTYEGAFGSGSIGAEGHAAFTFCAIASLVLLGKLNESLTDEEMDRIRRYCLRRQLGGFTGRPNKEEDTCYSFWVGATLEMLESTHFANSKENIDYILHNQNPIIGGIGKQANDYPDPLHTFLGIAGLSLAKYENLNPINAALTMSETTVRHMKSLHILHAK